MQYINLFKYISTLIRHLVWFSGYNAMRANMYSVVEVSKGLV